VAAVPRSWTAAYTDALPLVRAPDEGTDSAKETNKAHSSGDSTPWELVLAFALTKIAHCCVCSAFVYLLLVLLTLLATPFPPCVTLFDSCECSCQVVDGDNPDTSSTYHPGAPGRITLDGWSLAQNGASLRTVRPYEDGRASLCGVCPIEANGQPWPRCAKLAHPTLASDPVANQTADTSCYRPSCSAGVTAFLKNPSSDYKWARTLGARLCALENGLDADTRRACNIAVLKRTPGHRWPAMC
jgi:hypothetical protein